MNRMLGVSSLVLVFIVLFRVVYFNIKFEAIQSQSEIIDYYVYGRINKLVLYIVDLIGFGLGVVAYLKSRDKLGLIGICISLIIFLKLMSQSY